jgi:hypothetical protein
VRRSASAALWVLAAAAAALLQRGDGSLCVSQRAQHVGDVLLGLGCLAARGSCAAALHCVREAAARARSACQCVPPPDQNKKKQVCFIFTFLGTQLCRLFLD